MKLARALQLQLTGRLSDEDLASLSPTARDRLATEVSAWLREDMKQNQLVYYEPVNDDARQVHLSMARQLGIKGGNKSPVAGTRVLTGRGMIPVEEVKVGDAIPGASSWPGEVIALHPSEDVVPVFRPRTKRGYEITANAEHPVWTAKPCAPKWHRGVSAAGKGVETRFKDISIGDFVRIKFTGAFPESCEITPDDARFLGLMTGDGSWSAPSGVMKFTSADEAPVAWLEAYLAEHGLASRRYAKAGTVAISLEWCNIAFKRRIADRWGISLTTAPAKRVPEVIWRGTRAVIAAFVSAYGDTDGCATTKPSVVWTSASEGLLRDVQRLVARFGILSSLRRNKDNGPFRSWRLEITGRNLRWYVAHIGFRLARKQARLPAGTLPSRPIRWDRIVAVEPAGHARVYGLTVSPHHRYLADGFLNGNSGKTGTLLAEIAIQMTSVCPTGLLADYPRSKLRGRSIRARLVVTSLVNAWDNNLKHKLQWFFWNGRPEDKHGLIGDPRCGHWGFIPRRFLIDGDWDKSWNEKHRILTLRHPRTQAVWSTLQVMSMDQDLDDFNQGAFDLIGHDEIPPEEIYRANMIRAMELHGQLLIGGTPPDDRTGAVSVGWFYDQILAPGFEGSDPEAVFAVSLWTERNRTLEPAWVEQFSRDLTADQRAARLHGESLHLSGLVVHGFTEKARTWCFTCEAPILPVGGACPQCAGRDVTTYCHLWDDEDLTWPGPREWPVLFYIDPHQSRPAACAWYKVDPDDQWWQVAELEVSGDAATVKREVERLERESGLGIPLWRKGDPKITAQTNQFAQSFEGETFTIKRAFDDVGFLFDAANTNFSVAVDRVEQALRPNRYTRAPRLRIHRACRRTAFDVTHFTWQGGRHEPGETREKPSRKNSDFVALLRYLAMDDADWRGCQALRHHERINLLGRDRVGRNAIGW